MDRGVLYVYLHREHGLLAWTDRAAIGQYKNMTADLMIPLRSAGGFGFLPQTAMALSALLGGERLT